MSITCEEAEMLNAVDGGEFTIRPGVYINLPSAMFFEVELGFNDDNEPAVRVNGHDLDDKEVSRVVMMNTEDGGFFTLIRLLMSSEYLGEL